MKFLPLKTVTSICLFMALFSINPVQISAQSTSRESHLISENWKKMRGGVFFSTDFHSINGAAYNDLYNFDYSGGTNFSFGMQWLIQITDRVELGFDPGYSRKNFTVTENCQECAEQRVSAYKLGYLQVPVYARLYAYSSRLDVYGILGANLAMNVGGRQSVTLNDTTSDFNDVMSNRFLTGARIGLGFNYNLNYRNSIGFDLTYNHFFTSQLTSANLDLAGVSIAPSFLYRF